MQLSDMSSVLKESGSSPPHKVIEYYREFKGLNWVNDKGERIYDMLYGMLRPHAQRVWESSYKLLAGVPSFDSRRAMKELSLSSRRTRRRDVQ